jgi:hypothetical protein
MIENVWEWIRSAGDADNCRTVTKRGQKPDSQDQLAPTLLRFACITQSQSDLFAKDRANRQPTKKRGLFVTKMHFSDAESLNFSAVLLQIRHGFDSSALDKVNVIIMGERSQ